jgi:uncharacterized protein (TIGR02996 family)
VSEQDKFLKALAASEDDTTTRMVYADWLDDHGEHEEADRQRRWPAAKAWLVRFCRDHEADGYGELVISYAKLLELGREAVAEADENGFGFYCGSNEEMCNALRANPGEFWKNWSIVTGIPLPPGAETKSYFSCAC